jgi:hypothetical protein
MTLVNDCVEVTRTGTHDIRVDIRRLRNSGGGAMRCLLCALFRDISHAGKVCATLQRFGGWLPMGG